MEQHFWWIFALMQPLGFAGSSLISQHFKLTGTAVAMVRSSIVFICLLPIALSVEIPTQPIFYIVTIIAGILAFAGDSLVLNSSAKFGAGPTSRLLPISPLVAFVFWLGLHPDVFYEFLNKPLIGAGIVLAMVLCVFAVSALRHCDISKKTLLYIAPVIVIYAMTDVLNKTAQDNSGFWSGIIWYTFILSIIAVITGSYWNMKNKRFKQTITCKTTLRVGFLIALCYMFGMLGRNISMVYTPNPAYTSIIAGTTPLLVVLYHKIFNIKDESNIKAGLVFAFSVMVMIYLATLI